MAQDGGKVVSFTHRPLLPQEILLVLLSVRGWVDPRAIVRSEGLCQWIIPMTPPGIEPATFQFVAHHLNHCATVVPFMYTHTHTHTHIYNLGGLSGFSRTAKECVATCSTNRFIPKQITVETFPLVRIQETERCNVGKKAYRRKTPRC